MDGPYVRESILQNDFWCKHNFCHWWIALKKKNSKSAKIKFSTFSRVSLNSNVFLRKLLLFAICFSIPLLARTRMSPVGPPCRRTWNIHDVLYLFLLLLQNPFAESLCYRAIFSGFKKSTCLQIYVSSGSMDIWRSAFGAKNGPKIGQK